MTRRDAQDVLLSCRPGREPANDPEVAAALELMSTDAELREWYEQHRAWDAAVRKKLNTIPVPYDLKSAILAGPKIVTGPAHWWTRRAALMAAAALIAFLLTLAVMLIKRPAPAQTFADFRAEIIGRVLREYRMDLETNDMRQIRAFLDSRGAPADYEVPAGFQPFKLAGCGILKSQGKTVSMVCYEDQQNQLVWLFFAKSVNWKDRPPPSAAFRRVFACPTASWSQNDSVYVIASSANRSEPELRKLSGTQ